MKSENLMKRLKIYKKMILKKNFQRKNRYFKPEVTSYRIETKKLILNFS